MRYFALGGDADLMDVDAHLAGLVPLPPVQRDMLAHAVNERLDELISQHRVPYARAFRQEPPAAGPLAALVGLLDARRPRAAGPAARARRRRRPAAGRRRDAST